MNEPLAIKLRPKKIDDIIGQKHLIGNDKIISNLIKNKKLFSMIFYGKPGIGKTSLAKVITNELDLKYRELNAVINNKKDFDMVVEEAKLYGNLVLIMDEIHRLNKDKQDLLLPVLESGLITLIGMTTSNPYHSINPAIRSRCQIFELKELTSEVTHKIEELDYTTIQETQKVLVNNYNSKTGVVSTMFEYEGGYNITTNVNLSVASRLYIFSADSFKLNTEPKVVKFEMEAQGFKCE